MRLSKQFFAATFPPQRHADKPTSELLTDGLIAHFASAGIPHYMPVGKAILCNIESALLRQADKIGFDVVEIPSIMGNDTIEDGQEVGEEFRSKFMALTDRMSGYHLLSTPEMLFVRLAQSTLLSHRQLPVRQVYMNDFFRQIHDARSILKGKQFRVFGGISLEKDAAGVTQGLEAFRTMTEMAFEAMGLPFHVERNRGYLDSEYFYLTDGEGDNLVLDGINKTERVKALSLAMAYHYGAEKNLAIRYRTSTNDNGKLSLVTYGLGTQRLLYCIMDHYRDEKGFNLPDNLRPFDISLIPRSQGDQDAAERAYNHLKESGQKVCMDDRYRLRLTERGQAADYIGCSYNIVISADGLTIKNRDGHTVKRFQTMDEFIASTDGRPAQTMPPFSHHQAVADSRIEKVFSTGSIRARTP